MDTDEIQKNSKILVTVEEVLPDIIVVSFHFKAQLFQGVLLDSRKKLLPCGIVAPAHELSPLGPATLPAEDKLYSASQRYSYFQDKTTENKPILESKRSIRLPGRLKNSRMTVRLRPRQVLCSKCRGICNENSENVDVSRKKNKCDETVEDVNANARARPGRRLRSSGEISPRPVFPDNPRTQLKRNSQSNVPQVSKKKKLLDSIGSDVVTLLPAKSNINGKVQKIKIINSCWQDERMPLGSAESEILSVEGSGEMDPLSIPTGDESLSDQPLPSYESPVHIGEDPLADEDIDPLDFSQSNPRLLRNNRSIGSMEDLWDENVFEDSSKKVEIKLKSRTPVIKISYGSGSGEGTVLKITAKPDGDGSADSELPREVTKCDASAKAAKKALKRAKKEARKNVADAASPARSFGGTSPRYPNVSPRYFAASGSPRQTVGTSSQTIHKKRRHKVKHKKKHKEDKKYRELPGAGDTTGGRTGVEQECLRQKLSINLKRLNANAYMMCASSSPTASDYSDEPLDVVPDFPDSSIMGHLADQISPLTSCRTTDGRQVAVGDVVWGKIHGFPWWPGKVLRISESSRESEARAGLSAQAHVAWYGSSTSSLMSCDQLNPFLETFKARYNKKKRGAYKEAIKQATREARHGDANESEDSQTSHTSAGSTGSTATASQPQPNQRDA